SVVARYTTNGSLDTSFGTSGVTTVTTSGFGVTGLALQQDGKIVLVGATGINLTGAFLGQLALVRLDTNGAIDTSFGTGGLSVDSDGLPFVGLSVAIQSDGKIVATGAFTGPGPEITVVARFSADGSLDSTFGTSGEVMRSLMFGSALSIQPDGKIVVAGDSFNAPVLIRLNTDGSVDNAFGSSGALQVSDPGSEGAIYGMTLQTDSKIVIAGSTVPAIGSNKQNFLLIRCNGNGALDNTFGTGGVVTTDFDGLEDAATSVAVQSDGEIVVAGTGFAQPSSQAEILPASSASLLLGFALAQQGGNFGLARYNSDGSLDTNFGSNGKLITAFQPQVAAAAISIAIQTDGKIVAAGTVTVGSRTDFALARYQSSETPGDFSLSADQESQTVDAGSSASFVIGTQSVAGVAPPNAIALAALVNPAGAGVTASFSTVLVPVGSSSTLSVTAATGTPANRYTITVFGTAGTVTHNLTLTLNVQTAGFSLGFSQPSITAVRPQKITITVAINRINGFDGTVTVSAPGNLPDGIVLKGNSPVSTTGSSASFVFKVKQRAAAGSDSLTFTGTDENGHSQSATVTLVVQ
ncbi:MAG: hypothetical protein ACREDR_07510, partial [Blastocatellia bacterium]